MAAKRVSTRLPRGTQAIFPEEDGEETGLFSAFMDWRDEDDECQTLVDSGAHMRSTKEPCRRARTLGRAWLVTTDDHWKRH
eukprot:7343436-Pyramimonas_sp.AAC.1